MNVYWQYYWWYLAALALAGAVASVIVAYGRGYRKGCLSLHDKGSGACGLIEGSSYDFSVGYNFGENIGQRRGFAAGRAPFANHKRGAGGRFIKNTGE